MTGAPVLDERPRGWLRHMWEKATTPDDWSSSGDPHPWWDRESSPPFTCFPRFDLSEPSYALAIMSDLTPAWREVYARIADELIARHTTFWAVIDWVTLIGRDPGRERYPPEWQILLPEALRGRYESPGWCGNGLEPWGLQPDPIGADGNLFFRGFLNLLLGLYRYISGDDKWERSFPVCGYQEREFRWSHSRIAEFLALQMQERPQGPHCENTKVWPNCVSGAGAGLLLYDALCGTRYRAGFDRWIDFAQQHYMETTRGELSWFAAYYDPIEEVPHVMPGHASAVWLLESATYMYPADRELVERLYEMAMRKLGWSVPGKRISRLLPDPHPVGRALLLAQEFGDDETAARLREVVEHEFEPRMFGEEQDRFGFWFGLDEPWPRGQKTGVLMMSELGEPGTWWRIFNEPNLAKYEQPTVEGVDYPDLAIAQAYNDVEEAVLWVRTCPGRPSRRGAATAWRVSNLPDPARVSVTCDGQEFRAARVTAEDAVEIFCDIDDHLFRISLGEGRTAGAPKRAQYRAPSSQPQLRPNRVADIPSSLRATPIIRCACCSSATGVSRRSPAA